jgi:hypothetical protein
MPNPEWIGLDRRCPIPSDKDVEMLNPKHRSSGTIEVLVWHCPVGALVALGLGASSLLGPGGICSSQGREVCN